MRLAARSPCSELERLEDQGLEGLGSRATIITPPPSSWAPGAEVGSGWHQKPGIPGTVNTVPGED